MIKRHGCVSRSRIRRSRLQIKTNFRLNLWKSASLLLAFITLTTACSGSQALKPTSTATASRTPIQLGPTSPSKPPGLQATAPPSPLTATPTLFPLQPISDADWSRGPQDAAVTLVVYADFQSVECVWLYVMLSELRARHPQDLRVIFRHFPQLHLHDKASLASEAAEAAGAQGFFWEMHDLLFQKHSEWYELSVEDFSAWLKQAALAIDMDQNQFAQDIDNRVYEERMRNLFFDTNASGIPGTPFIFFNRDWYRLPISLINLEASIRLELLKPSQYAVYPPFTVNIQAEYLARLRLPQGDVLIQLYPQYAPLAVNSFVFLAGQGWYDNNPVHRVEPGAWIESGDPTGTGWGGAGYSFENEISPSLTFDQPGMVALISQGPGTNGSQFFITLAPLPILNGNRTIFGRVIDGLDLLEALHPRSTLEDLLSEPEAVILSVSIENP